MIKLNDEIIVKIEKITFGGLALARYGEEKFVVFVEGALRDEVLKVKIVKLNKKYARAEIIEIIEPSKHRINPPCALYNVCGSCDNQICDYDYSIEEKTSILKDIFSSIVGDKVFDCIKSPKSFSYRCKIQYPARQTKNSKRILLGYYKKNSHDLINIKFCPIQPEAGNEIAKIIREEFFFDCYCEKTNKGLLKNVLLRISNNEKEVLLTFVLNCDENQYLKFYKTKFEQLAQKIIEIKNEIKGICVNFNNQKTNKILGEKTLLIKGINYIIENLKDKKYKISSSSFFQVNPLSAVNLFDVVKNNIKQNSTILDAYGGVGAIGIYLSEKASKITLVEENKDAILMAGENFKLNNIENYEIFEGDAKKHLSNFVKEKRTFDYVILDPPRQGCEQSALKTLSLLAKNIIYISCNPQTLKRDMEILIKDNFIPQFVQGVDLFPQTHHIEAVSLFIKKKMINERKDG